MNRKIREKRKREKGEAGKEPERLQGGASPEPTGKVNDLLKVVENFQLTDEETRHLLETLRNRTRRAYTKAEKEGYKNLVEKTNESLKDIHEKLKMMTADNSGLHNTFKEMEGRKKEMDASKKLQNVKAEKLELKFMNEMSPRKLHDKPPEDNFGGLPFIYDQLFIDWTYSQMHEFGENKTRKTILNASPSIKTPLSPITILNQEFGRMQRQVDELKKEVQVLKNHMKEEVQALENQISKLRPLIRTTVINECTPPDTDPVSNNKFDT